METKATTREKQCRPVPWPPGLATPRTPFAFSSGTEHSEGFVLLKESDLPAHRAREGPAPFICREGRERRQTWQTWGPVKGTNHIQDFKGEISPTQAPIRTDALRMD